MTYEIKTSNGYLRVSDTDYKDILKKPVLALRKENVIVKLASFNNEQAMKEFLECYGVCEDKER